MNIILRQTKFILKKGCLFIWVVTCLALFSSCVTSTKIEVLHPAAITLPANVRTIGVINRFIPRDVDSSNLYSSSCAFGDIFNFDKEASDSCINSLFIALENSPRFRDLDITDELVRDGAAFFPPPMDSEFVQEACAKYRVNALAVLEGFLTNSDISTKMSSTQVPYTSTYYVNGRPYYQTQYRTVYYYTATLNLFYSVGFRIYGNDGAILDEFRIDREYTTSKTSSNSMNYAVNDLPQKYNIVRMIAHDIGKAYSIRISPMFKLEKRHYYTTPNRNFSAAHDSVMHNNWPAAKNIWMNAYLHGKNSQKGISAFNLALANEIENNLDIALQWANEAKNNFQKRNKEDHLITVNNYITILNNRLGERQKLMEQMSR